MPSMVMLASGGTGVMVKTRSEAQPPTQTLKSANIRHRKKLGPRNVAEENDIPINRHLGVGPDKATVIVRTGCFRNNERQPSAGSAGDGSGTRKNRDSMGHKPAFTRTNFAHCAARVISRLFSAMRL